MKGNNFSSFDEMHDCAVEELEDCKDNTPANIMDALFKYIRRILPCKHPKVKSSARVSKLNDEPSSSAFGLKVSYFGLMLSVLSLLH